MKVFLLLAGFFFSYLQQSQAQYSVYGSAGYVPAPRVSFAVRTPAMRAAAGCECGPNCYCEWVNGRCVCRSLPRTTPVYYAPYAQPQPQPQRELRIRIEREYSPGGVYVLPPPPPPRYYR